MPYEEAHELFAHLGSHAKCKICRMTKGCMRKIYKKVDPHRENRPGYKFYCDTITWSVRSRHGNKYTTVLRCAASHYVIALHHYLRSDVVDMIRHLIEVTRKDPAYHNCNYKVFSEIHLDNAGEWAVDSTAWNQVVDDLGIKCRYSCPDRKESNAGG